MGEKFYPLKIQYIHIIQVDKILSFEYQGSILSRLKENLQEQTLKAVKR